MIYFSKLVSLIATFLYSNKSFSQEGEDQLLYRLIGNKKKGFFIDVGAHHPFLYSNTYKFYKMGWNGINIDAMPGSMSFFKKFRSRDINLEIAISQKPQKLKYFIFNEPALNTFSLKEAELKDGLNHYKVTDIIELKTNTLGEILTQYLPKNQEIDFLTIDVEGLDLEVLKSNDWKKFQPRYVLVEELSSAMDFFTSHNECNKFLTSSGYYLIARTRNTSFYKLSDE